MGRNPAPPHSSTKRYQKLMQKLILVQSMAMLGGELVTFVDGIFIACREELFFGVLNYPFPYTYLLRHLSRLKFCQKRWELFFAAFAAKLSKHLVLVNLF